MTIRILISGEVSTWQAYFMKRLCMERNSTTGGGLMKRNNVNRVLLNDFLGADYADYSVDTNTLNVTFLRQKESV